jgi:hypothetical protein
MITIKYLKALIMRTAGVVIILLALVISGCISQQKSKGDPPVKAAQNGQVERPQRTLPSPFPVIPVKAFVHTWIGSANCSGKGTMSDTLVIVMKDSSNVYVSGFYGYPDKVSGKIRGYTINIPVQDVLSAGSGMTVSGRLVLSNDWKTLSTYFTMQLYDAADKCTGEMRQGL